MRHCLYGIAAGLFALGAPLAAEEIPAPLLDTHPTYGATYGAMAVYVRGDEAAPDAPVDPMRAAGPGRDPFAGFTRENPAVSAYLARPQSFYLGFTARMATDGRITDCRMARPEAAPYDEAVLCAGLVQGLKGLPALDREGVRVAAPVRIFFSASAQRAPNDGSIPGLFGDRATTAPPAPPPPRPGPRLTEQQWPPSPIWLRFNSAAPASTALPQAPLLPLTAPVGLVFGDKSAAAPGCAIVVTSGDAKRDAEACRLVARKFKPRWAADEDPSKRHLALLVSPGPAAAAVAADAALASRASMAGDTARAFAERIAGVVGPQSRDWQKGFAMTLTLDGDGRVTHCRIVNSSFRDDADLAACRLAETEARLLPERDSFGRSVPKSYYYWEAVREGVPALP